MTPADVTSRSLLGVITACRSCTSKPQAFPMQLFVAFRNHIQGTRWKGMRQALCALRALRAACCLFKCLKWQASSGRPQVAGPTCVHQIQEGVCSFVSLQRPIESQAPRLLAQLLTLRQPSQRNPMPKPLVVLLPGSQRLVQQRL